MFDTMEYVLQTIDAIKSNKFTLNVFFVLNLNHKTGN